MDKITTVDQARSLPEIESDRRMYVQERQADGSTRRVMRARELSPVRAAPDAIAAFTDIDGRPMRVVHTVEDGWCKTPL